VTRVEFPSGSGRWAWYTPREKTLMRRHVVRAEKGVISRAQLESELGVLHELKVVFGVDLVADAVVDDGSV